MVVPRCHSGSCPDYQRRHPTVRRHCRTTSRSFCRDCFRFAHRLPGTCGGSTFDHTTASALLHFGRRWPTYFVASTMLLLNHLCGLGLSKAVPTHTALISLSDFLGSPLYQNTRRSPQPKPHVPHHKLHVCAAAVQGEIAAHCSRQCTTLHPKLCTVSVAAGRRSHHA